MKILITLAVTAASLLAATQASARMTDQDFIQANRCAALIAAAELQGGPQDTAAIETKIRAERYQHPGFVEDMGNRARQTAQRESRHASDTLKARLIAERDGVCRALSQ